MINEIDDMLCFIQRENFTFEFDHYNDQVMPMGYTNFYHCEPGDGFGDGFSGDSQGNGYCIFTYTFGAAAHILLEQIGHGD